MPYVQPNAEIFKARFPEFAPVPNTLVNTVLAEAVDAVGDTWLERDRAKAQMYLAAHLLAMEGEPGRSQGVAAGEGGGHFAVTGPVKRERVGDVEVEYAGASASSGGGSGSGSSLSANYGTTSYGRLYLEFLRKNFPPVAVV
ncbi:MULTISPECIES: DUF4054 domain-containing protein [unclassified Shinella]|uniref:DUF4054 domain-containing protein n=1 Tax=unclassified Shinella TaxID=2643062 RepID=UPI00234F3B68|nr:MULTISPECIES: DUF4054 domain-containing protein [unclassified Shinella]